MAITKLNSLAIPANTVVAADLSYPLTSFSSTGIDDNADATAITINSSENVGIGTASPSDKLHVYGGASGASAHSYTQLHVEHSSHAAIQLSSPNTTESAIFFSDPQSNSAGGVGYYHAEDFMYLRANGATRLRVDSDGIKFGSDTNAANALDDYEEGTWTPAAASSSSNVAAIANANGHFTKIGNVVTINFYADITPSATNTQIRLQGLPYSVADSISGSQIEATGIAFEDSNLYTFFALGSSSEFWIEYDRPIQGSSDTANRSYRGSLSYFH